MQVKVVNADNAIGAFRSEFVSVRGVTVSVEKPRCEAPWGAGGPPAGSAEQSGAADRDPALTKGAVSSPMAQPLPIPATADGPVAAPCSCHLHCLYCCRYTKSTFPANGHHALWGSGAVLTEFSGFRITTQYMHDITFSVFAENLVRTCMQAACQPRGKAVVHGGVARWWMRWWQPCHVLLYGRRCLPTDRCWMGTSTSTVEVSRGSKRQTPPHAASHSSALLLPDAWQRWHVRSP